MCILAGEGSMLNGVDVNGEGRGLDMDAEVRIRVVHGRRSL